MLASDIRDTLYLHAGFSLSETKPGFLGRLRPYQGLDETDFVEVMESLCKWHPNAILVNEVDRQAVAAVWWICDSARDLALRPNSPLQMHNIIAAPELELIRMWVEVIESFAVNMLRGVELPECIYRLLYYLVDRQINVTADRWSFVINILPECLLIDDPEVVEVARELMLRSNRQT